MKPPSRTIDQKTNWTGFPKPGEFIEMTGTHMLEASERAIFNILYESMQTCGVHYDVNATTSSLFAGRKPG
jgi:hypothetical protein